MSGARPGLIAHNTETNVRRGRQKPPSSPSSWIRSASTSSILRKRNPEIDVVPQKSMEEPISLGMANRSSSSTNILVDVLPSFEMYNTLHRHIPQGNVDPDQHDFPPSYGEVQSQRDSIMPRHENPETSVLERIQETGSGLHLNSLHPLSTQHLNLQQSRIGATSSNVDNNTIEDDLNDSDNIFIDKLYTLPKLTTPVEIDIRITKNATQPHEKPEEESILKEYTSGDVIHGYCVIENRSSQPLKFEMFYVTLEAYISIIDRNKGKRTVKRFLRMVDLSASWSYNHMILSSGVNFVAGDVDYDKSVFGLNNNRILEPGIKYKKIFMFKLPNQLLDITCKQEQFNHCLLPPSFGIDKYRNNGKYSAIKVNSVLGCGHLGIKGSPILTYDLVDENTSINYTVDARIVGKDLKTQKLNIMKEQVYNIRVLPFGFSNALLFDISPSTQLKNLIRLIEDKLKVLENLFDKLEKNLPITNDDLSTTEIYGSLDNNKNISSKKIDELKMKNLYINTCHKDEPNGKGLYTSNDLENLTLNVDTVESELNYRIKGKNKSSSNLTAGLFSGLLGSQSSSSSLVSISNHVNNSTTTTLNSQRSNTNLKSKNIDTNSKTEKSGLIIVSCKVPELSLPYCSPSLLRKTNIFEAKNQYDQENWNNLVNTLPEFEKEMLTKLNITLRCFQSNNSGAHEPPDIQAVTTELVCITAKSDNSIPIKLEQELLMNEEKMKKLKLKFMNYQNKVKDYARNFNKNLKELNELYNKSGTFSTFRELKFTDFLSTQIYNDVESLSNLEVCIIHLYEVFKKQIHTLKNNLPIPNSNDLITMSSAQTAPSSRSASTTRLTATFSGSPSSVSNSKTSTAMKFTNQIVHQWKQTKPLEYEREVTVNLEYNPELRETLVPSFESCLCCRLYCVRVCLKFDNHVGVASIDVPVRIKKFI